MSDAARGVMCAAWWEWKGSEANTSVALEAALEALPPTYKARGREAHGERYIDRDGRVRSVVSRMRAV